MSQEIQKNLRYELDDKLAELLPESWHLYFQPPENLKLKYPALTYRKTSGDTKFANNGMYKYDRQYELTFIYEDPDDETPFNVMSQFMYCRADRHFVTNNLHHDTVVLYF
jgi:hypothetical protein